MGLYDRDYIRDERVGVAGTPVRARSAIATWSANTWLIVICVAVFVIDGFLPIRDVPTGVTVLADPHTPASMVKLGSGDYREIPLQRVSPNGATETKVSLCRPLVEKSTGQFVGWAEVMPMHWLQSWLHFSTRLGFLGFEWWRFIGFQFLHANTTHLIFNMLGLFFIGPLVEEYLGSKRYLAFYLLCGIFGAIMYLTLNLGGYVATSLSGHPIHLPGLLFDDTSTPLVGASAGIFGVLMAGAYLAPNAIVYVFYFLPMQLRTVAYAFLAMALLTVFFGGKNAGGEAGHIGGALAGYYFIRHPHHLHNFFDLLGRVDPTSHHYRPGRVRSQRRPMTSVSDTMEINRILDKIRSDGLQSLSDDEKSTLQNASRQGRAG